MSSPLSISPVTTFDEVPYISHPYPQSHPERLAAIARLLGLDPPPIERCRVLELGCGVGRPCRLGARTVIHGGQAAQGPILFESVPA